MKPLTLLLLFAIPLFASEDSPLVAAAKRNGRANMPKKVITNESVKTSKGRVTTTKTQPPPIALPVVPPAKPAVAEKKKTKPLTQVAEEKRAAQKRERRKALAEHAAQEAEQKPPR